VRIPNVPRREIRRSGGSLAVVLFLLLLAAGCGRPPEEQVAPASAKPKEPEAVEIKADPLNTGVATSDAALTAKVKARLAADPEVRAALLEVDAQGSRVTLWGKVSKPEIRTQAESLARGTPGVASVSNLVTLGGKGR
jgi:BON domain